jgi:Kef-type K+ transport system membrane component KefB
VWATAIVISALAIVSKVVGCGAPMLLEGMLTATRVGVGMLPRGEVALIVALVGLQTNAISGQAYAVVIFMAGVTTLIAPPLLRYLFRGVTPSTPSDDLEDELSRTSIG